MYDATMNEPTPAVKVSAVKIDMSVPIKRIQDILCCALEGGSNYWYMIEEFIEPPKLVNRTDDERVYRHIDYPTNPGGALLFSVKEDVSDEEGERQVWRLDLQSIEKGLNIMSSKYPRHFMNFMSDDEDAETGDVFLQCCLFGKLVYG